MHCIFIKLFRPFEGILDFRVNLVTEIDKTVGPRAYFGLLLSDGVIKFFI